MSSEFYIGYYGTSYMVTSRVTKVKLNSIYRKNTLILSLYNLGYDPWFSIVGF